MNAAIITNWSKRSRGLYDNGDWTISCGSNYFCDGSHRKFQIEIIHRVYVAGAGSPKGDGTNHDALVIKRHAVTLPLIKFRTAFKLRALGLLSVYKMQSKIVHRVFN